MATLREIAATLLFVLAMALVIQLFASGFAWGSLLGALLCFALAYACWPSRRRGQRDDASGWIDLFEVVIELPVQALLWLLRWVGGLFRWLDF
ncbi:MAG: hypothetical protein ABWY06_02425 [Pseudomonas sp.]|uniref:hypothetical protein n=1 Tax=Pseudomonas sp. TaxID=306 RepID=UPI00339AFBE8